MAEERQFAHARKVLDRHDTEGLSRTLGESLVDGRHHAAKRHLAPLLQRLEVGVSVDLRAMGVAHVLQHDGILVERMGREIDAHELALLVEFLDGRPPFRLGQGRMDHGHVVAPEEAQTGIGLVHLVALAVAHEQVDEEFSLGVGGEELLAHDPESIEAATIGQALESLSVDVGQVDALGKVEDVLVGTVLLALRLY